jgi:hypothetical protein
MRSLIIAACLVMVLVYAMFNATYVTIPTPSAPPACASWCK